MTLVSCKKIHKTNLRATIINREIETQDTVRGILFFLLVVANERRVAVKSGVFDGFGYSGSSGR